MAANIANVLGVKDRRDGYFESSDYVVSWCVGHLVELKNAADYDPKYKTWDIANLQIIPPI